MNFNELKEKLKDINLRGRNLENVGDSSFRLLSEFDFSEYDKMEDFPIQDTRSITPLLERLQQKYEDMYIALEQDNSIKPMEYDEDGKVIIKPDMFFHRTIGEVDVLKNISLGGILASEWFGNLESEHEGCFCAFLNTTNNPENEKSEAMKKHNNTMGLASSTFNGECVVYFDSDHPLMKELAGMDFFEYEHLKKVSPEDISKLYSEDTIKLFEEVISPLSECGYTVHDTPGAESTCWKAIPGGIPPQLINGICISSKSIEMNANVSLLMELFPNATIFDETRHVLNRNREIKELTQLDEVSLKDRLSEMSLGELSATKKGFETKLGGARDLLALAKASNKSKNLERGANGNER